MNRYVMVVPTLLLGLYAPMTRAELPDTTETAPDCGSGWWIERADIPLTVHDTPQLPTILMPVTWSPRDATAGAEGLSVGVVDPEGNPVPGAVTYDRTLYPRDVARWSPAIALELSTTYQMLIQVLKPPQPVPPGCSFIPFERRLEFTTGAGQISPGAISIVSFEGRDSVTRDLETGPELCGEGAHQCENAADVCCVWVDIRRERDIVGEIVSGSVANAEPLYNVIVATVSGLPDGPRDSVFEGVVQGEHYWPYARLVLERSQSLPDNICMNVRLFDVMAQRLQSETQMCGFTAEYEMFPYPFITTCPESVCPERPEGKAESIADPSGENEGRSETDAQGQGCTGGGLPATAGAALLLAASFLRAKVELRWRRNVVSGGR